MIEDDKNHKWEYRIVWRESGLWRVGVTISGGALNCTHWMDGSVVTEAIIQRRRKRDIYDPTPCEGIEHPIWRDWEASPDPAIQGVLIAKGMPFRSLEK